MSLFTRLAAFSLAAITTMAWAGDAPFIETAAQGGMAEVAGGQLAATRATSAEVRDFGLMMVKDHGAANQKLAALAQSEGVAMPESYSAEQAAMLQALKSAESGAFDRMYMSHMVEKHLREARRLAGQE
jgi:putative membrane protein